MEQSGGHGATGTHSTLAQLVSARLASLIWAAGWTELNVES